MRDTNVPTSSAHIVDRSTSPEAASSQHQALTSSSTISQKNTATIRMPACNSTTGPRLNEATDPLSRDRNFNPAENFQFNSNSYPNNQPSSSNSSNRGIEPGADISAPSEIKFIAINLLTRLQRLPLGSKVALVFTSAISLARMIACAVVLAMYHSQPCDQPLKSYLAFVVIFEITNSFFHVIIRAFRSETRDRRNSILRLICRCNDIGNVLNLILFFLGNFWIFSTFSCKRTSPAIYFTSLVLILSGYFLLIFPIVLFTAFILCMPLLLYFLRPFISVPSATVPATESIIDSIPLVVFKFTPPDIESQPSSASAMPSKPNLPDDHINSELKASDTTASNSRASVISKPFILIAYFVSKRAKWLRKSKHDEAHQESLPLFELSNRDDCMCPICLSEYEDRDRLRLLKCNHHYHAECLDQWLRVNRVCPLCKKDVVTNQNTGDTEDYLNPPTSTPIPTPTPTPTLTPPLTRTPTPPPPPSHPYTNIQSHPYPHH